MENSWEHYKKIYRSVSAPDETVNSSWESLSNRLPQQDRYYMPSYAQFGFAFLGVIILLAAGIIGASAQAKPGDTLYSIKEFTNTVNSKVFRKTNTAAEKPNNPVIKKPKATPAPTKAPTATPTIAPEVKGARTETKIQQKIQEKKVLPPQTGQAIRNNNGNSNSNKNGVKHENQGNNSQNGQNKPRNESAEVNSNKQNNSEKK